VEEDDGVSPVQSASDADNFFAQSNKTGIAPVFHSVEYMLAVEVKNLIFNVHLLARKIWSTENWTEYLYKKGILDINRKDVQLDSTSKKYSLCKENKDDSPEIRSF
jgi:hypothetical protein